MEDKQRKDELKRNTNRTIYVLGIVLLVLVGFIVYYYVQGPFLSQEAEESQPTPAGGAAVFAQEIKNCLEGKDERARKACIYQVLSNKAVFKSDPRVCEEFFEYFKKDEGAYVRLCQDHYYMDQAVRAENKEICKKISDSKLTETCLRVSKPE